MAQYLQLIADKFNPLEERMNPLAGTEGARGAYPGGRMYHAETPRNKGREGMWLAPTQQAAKDYGPNVRAVDLPPNLKIATPDDRARIREGNGIDGLRAQGFHGVRDAEGNVYLFNRP
jgi:hypothetical protein